MVMPALTRHDHEKEQVMPLEVLWAEERKSEEEHKVLEVVQIQQKDIY
jgi:hypothetical protein